LESFEKSKENWSHELKRASSHYYETQGSGTKMRGKPTTISMVDLRCIRYATRSTPFKWQTDHFIRTVSCEAVWWNKFWNKKIHGWFRSHFQNRNTKTLTLKPSPYNYSPKPALFNRCARCTKICVGCTTKKGFTKMHHKLVTL